MTKPPVSPPSLDIPKKSQPSSPPHDVAAEGEETARKESKGRPARSTR